ncbi:hypothetical protein MNV49_005611 [Pseudohyphozyma bogoriensis]|nr:hypothetical protein MNV49_005611 [Pseudohyphozyma bogoriensis]
MDYFASTIDSLAKQASEITMYDVRSTINKAKAMVLNLSEMETKGESTLSEATNNEAWGASSTLMTEIAQGTHNFQLFNEIMPAIYQRFTDKEARQWRQIYKSLVLLEYLVKNGSERVIDDARAHLSLIKVLRNFHYTDENGKDQGINVRNRSKELAELLSDLDRVRQERRKAKQNKNKYTGVGNDGSGFGGGGPSFTSATGSRYGGFGSDSFDSGGYNGGGSSSGGGRGFSDSSARAAEYEEYDAGDWEDAPRRTTSSRATASASASTSRSKPTPATPVAAPAPVMKQPEVNLFDFDDDEQLPPPPAKQAAPIAAPSAGLDDDFDDFQSAPAAAPSFSAPAPAPAASSGHQNVFALLNATPAAPAAQAPRPQQAAPSPMGGFAAMQPQRPSYTSQTSSTFSGASVQSAASAPPAAKKPAADFSDLFGDFGGSTSAKPAGGPKLTMQQLAAQEREKQLFAMSGAGSKPSGGAASGGGGGNGWDSLLTSTMRPTRQLAPPSPGDSKPRSSSKRKATAPPELRSHETTAGGTGTSASSSDMNGDGSATLKKSRSESTLRTSRVMSCCANCTLRSLECIWLGPQPDLLVVLVTQLASQLGLSPSELDELVIEADTIIRRVPSPAASAESSDAKQPATLDHVVTTDTRRGGAEFLRPLESSRPFTPPRRPSSTPDPSSTAYRSNQPSPRPQVFIPPPIVTLPRAAVRDERYADATMSSFTLPPVLLAAGRNPVVAVGLPLALGWASGLITKTSIKTWYTPLQKPPGNPPPVVFPFAWTTLYASMGLASHFLVKAYDQQLPGTALKDTASLAIKLYWGSLVLNYAWTPLFFGLKQTAVALADIALLTPTVYALTYFSFQVDPRTIFLLAPYSAWLTFATYLNGGIWYLNFFPKSWSKSVKKDE